MTHVTVYKGPEIDLADVFRHFVNKGMIPHVVGHDLLDESDLQECLVDYDGYYYVVGDAVVPKFDRHVEERREWLHV